IRLKSDAEGLAIAGKLSEAHAKYRQIMLLVSGRQIKDPLLFDEVEQCKTDQDRIYAVILKSMEQRIAPNAPATTQNAEAGSYPPSFDVLKPGESTTEPVATLQAAEVKAAPTTAPRADSSAPAGAPSVAAAIETV